MRKVRFELSLFCFHSEFDCGRLDSPLNGNVRITGTRPGALATYSCNIGFNLEGGNENRRCIDHFGWDGTAPTCQRKFVDKDFSFFMFNLPYIICIISQMQL